MEKTYLVIFTQDGIESHIIETAENLGKLMERCNEIACRKLSQQVHFNGSGENKYQAVANHKSLAMGLFAEVFVIEKNN
jgi:hypothetical protein